MTGSKLAVSMRAMTGGQKIREWRQARGLKLRQFAEQIGCSVSNLWRIENDGQEPHHNVAAAIIKATRGKVTMADIYQNGRAA